MMTHAYQEIYLSKAQAALGDAFDYAVNTFGIPGQDFIKLFNASTVSKRMENGEPAFLAGKSGIEIASDVLLKQPVSSWILFRMNISDGLGNTGSGGQSATTNGILREATATSLQLSPTMIFKTCITHSTRRTFPNSLI